MSKVKFLAAKSAEKTGGYPIESMLEDLEQSVHSGNLEDAVVVRQYRNGTIEVGYAGMNSMNALGMLEIARAHIIDLMRK